MMQLEPRGRYTCAFCAQPIRDTEGCIDFLIEGTRAVLHTHCHVNLITGMTMEELSK